MAVAVGAVQPRVVAMALEEAQGPVAALSRVEALAAVEVRRPVEAAVPVAARVRAEAFLAAEVLAVPFLILTEGGSFLRKGGTRRWWAMEARRW